MEYYYSKSKHNIDISKLREYIQEYIGEQIAKGKPGAITDFISFSGYNTDEIIKFALEHKIDLSQFTISKMKTC